MHIQHVEAARHNQDQKYVQTKLTRTKNMGHGRQDHPLDNKTNQNQAVEIPANAWNLKAQQTWILQGTMWLNDEQKLYGRLSNMWCTPSVIISMVTSARKSVFRDIRSYRLNAI